MKDIKGLTPLDTKNYLTGLTLEELRKVLGDWGRPQFHAEQIWAWIYKRGITDFEAMSDLPLDLRKLLRENFYSLGLRLVKRLFSRDGTEKSLLELSDGHLIEVVSIPQRKRVTACISTQVGCSFACRFCASSLGKFKRNLTPAEMIGEVLYLRSTKGLTHLVFMGIGEPLDNYEHLLQTIRMIISPSAFNIGARRITVSTCGIIPGIKRLANEALQIELSISLHAADDKTRTSLMPINKRYPLRELVAVSKEYTEKTRRQLTFDYILIRGLNSSLKDAQGLSLLLKGIRLAKVNLIPANPIRELKIEPPSGQEISSFRDSLRQVGIKATVRKARGQDIEAACGQLRLRYKSY